MVLRPRIPAPRWDGGGNPEMAGKCTTFRPDKAAGYDPWFDSEYEEDCLAICNGDHDQRVCPIRHQCLLFALINNEAAGVWGGLPAHDRRALRFARRENPALEYAWHPPTERLVALEAVYEAYDDPEDLEDLGEEFELVV